MTKKDFERIAEIVASAPLDRAPLKQLAEHISRELATHEPRFDSEKFDNYILRLLLQRSVRENDDSK